MGKFALANVLLIFFLNLSTLLNVLACPYCPYPSPKPPKHHPPIVKPPVHKPPKSPCPPPKSSPKPPHVHPPYVPKPPHYPKPPVHPHPPYVPKPPHVKPPYVPKPPHYPKPPVHPQPPHVPKPPVVTPPYIPKPPVVTPPYIPKPPVVTPPYVPKPPVVPVTPPYVPKPPYVPIPPIVKPPIVYPPPIVKPPPYVPVPPIVWFRRDLRIEDNPALVAAAKEGSVLPVFIWCPKEEGQFYPGRVSRWWLKQSLALLDQSLKSLGVRLVLIKTHSTVAALLECIKAIQATKVVFNHLYDPVSLVRDHNIKEKLVEHGISVQSYNGDLLYEPWEVYSESGSAFTTFNSFWKKCLLMQIDVVSLVPPWQLIPAEGKVEECSLEELGLENETEKASNALLGRAWSPGWRNADKVLTEFVEHHLLHYSKERLKVGGNSTSLLSPYLHFGELSVRKVFQVTRIKQILWTNEGNSAGEESVNLFLRAIGLREYSRYLCFNFPFTHERALLGHLKYFPWNADPDIFKTWRQGRTGYPLVDAGMRELWATGWIHNRIRVIVSSFAVKMLLLPWKWGMKYFWDTLLDADLESDILGWQYISGGLPDGHELERLDNPEIVGSKFDPEGEYVRQWLPELARMPTEWIHHPWDAPLIVLRAAGVELGQNYPKPIIDIDLARERLTEAIFKMWEYEAAAKAAGSEPRNEVVVDNSNSVENLDTPKVVFLEKTPCPTISANDQKVPALQDSKNNAPTRKRPKYVVEEGQHQDNSQNHDKNTAISSIDQDVCSTADSSSCKKQCTSTSTYSFSVPQQCSSSSNLKWPWQEQIDMEQGSSKDGAM